tara:strand:+ start:161 stop:502 length:342 start_codon:yes stop_codon:yes gene_type:complete
MKSTDVSWNGIERVWEAVSPLDGTRVVALSREGLIDRLKVLEHQVVINDTMGLIDRLQLDVQQLQGKLHVALEALTFISQNTRERGTGTITEEALTRILGKLSNKDYSQEKLK